MAIASVVLDIKSNTDRALNDFKKFSAQLDNKFLISGLKLDVVRSALGQINREFQKAIGEQGLQAGQSLRAAQNQAALLTQTFKTFSSEASQDMAAQFSSALSSIAVNAGGTVEDIKKTMAATPWISTNLSEDVRKSLSEGILEAQKNLRRAGVIDNFGEIAAGFLSGKTTAGELIESGNPIQAFIGAQLSKKGGTRELLTDAEQRSKIFEEVLGDPAFRKQLDDMAKKTYGFRGIIEDLGSRLFNPEKGVFGSLRQVTMSVKDKTNVFIETEKLIESIFGKQGLFVNFFKQIGKIFGIEDPLKVVITGVRWITRQVNALNKFLQSPEIQVIVKLIQQAFGYIKDAFTKISDGINRNLEDPNSDINRIGNNIRKFFADLDENVQKELKDPTSYLRRVKSIGDSIIKLFDSIYKAVSAGDWNPSKIVESIKSIGISIRNLIMKIGDDIRGSDFSKQAKFFDEILQTSVTEIFKTIGTLINEAISTLTPDKIIGFVFWIIKTLNNAFTSAVTQIFNGNKFLGSLTAALLTGGVVAAFAKTMTLGVLGFAARLIAALPGGAMLNSAIAARATQFATRRSQQVTNRIPFFGGGRNRNADPNNPSASAVQNRVAAGSRREFNFQVLGRLDTIITLLRRAGGGGPDLDVDGDGPGGGGPNAPTRGGRRRGIRGRVGALARNRWVRVGAGGAAALGVAALIGGSAARSAEMSQEEQMLQQSRLTPQGTSVAKPPAPAKEPSMSGMSALGEVGMGALTGAQIGGALASWTGIGIPVGAAIGGVIGGAVPLMDKKVRTAALDSGDEIKKAFQDAAEQIKKSSDSGIKDFVRSWNSIGADLSKINFSDIIVNALKTSLSNITIGNLPNVATTTQTMLGSLDWSKVISTISKNLNSLSTALNPIGAIVNVLGKLVSGGNSNSSGPSNYQGLNYQGPALALEERMSGGNPLVVNDREFVIPRDGFPILADAVANRILPRSSQGDKVSAEFNVTLNVSGGLTTDNVNQLRGPVLAIIQEAWDNVTTATVSRGSNATG